MPPRYSTVAVIGTGPAGISALKALHEENTFEKIRAFERRDRPGGTWNYDARPQKFPGTYSSVLEGTIQTAMYSWLDTNVPAELMSFTHTPLPEGNSPISTHRYGAKNATRPYYVIAQYLLDLVKKYREYISFNSTVVFMEKTASGKWRLTLRRPEIEGDSVSDSQWQEEFDAVVVATGQYNMPYIPSIPGLKETVESHPEALEHVNAFRRSEDYTDKKVLVLGGSFSAGDVVGDIYTLVRGPLYVSQSSHSPFITQIWHLPNVEVKPAISKIQGQSGSNVRVTFIDGSQLEDIDKVIFATGYRFSFPFLLPEPIISADRLPGVYQHVFKIGDPSLALIGLVRAPLLFRMMEYEAVAVARYYAGRGEDLPCKEEQEKWEAELLEAKGDSYKFHDVTGEQKEHMNFLRDLAGSPADGTDAYELPEVAEEWLDRGFSVFRLKDEYWGKVRRGEVEVRV
ncbi:hypothetical protein BJY04DRAFT_107869 [Aspergillus karnatakaensis]|uniref:uncharacterized protein n=1 Tax=Aspergillus karnatakaensis TaxID=1810916 RepID=UPI003CCE2E21